MFEWVLRSAADRLLSVFLLVLGILGLWRAYSRERKYNRSLVKELIENAVVQREMVKEQERLRTSVEDCLRELRRH